MPIPQNSNCAVTVWESEWPVFERWSRFNAVLMSYVHYQSIHQQWTADDGQIHHSSILPIYIKFISSGALIVSWHSTIMWWPPYCSYFGGGDCGRKGGGTFFATLIIGKLSIRALHFSAFLYRKTSNRQRLRYMHMGRLPMIWFDTWRYIHMNMKCLFDKYIWIELIWQVWQSNIQLTTM